MYRIIAGLFSSSVIMISFYGMYNQDGPLSILMNSSPNVALIRISLATLLLIYSLSAYHRYGILKDGLRAASFGVMAFFTLSLFSDTSPFPGPLDLFFGIEGAVLALIASLDFARPKAVQKFMPAVPAIPVVDFTVAKIKKTEVPALSPARKVTQ